MRGEDFSAADPLQITFTPGVNEDTACAMLSIIDDNALEGDHEFTVAIDMTVPLIIIDNAAIEVMIEDNESMFYETVGTPLLVQRQMVLIISGNKFS